MKGCTVIRVKNHGLTEREVCRWWMQISPADRARTRCEYRLVLHYLVRQKPKLNRVN
jgi:hypothetical protein